ERCLNESPRLRFLENPRCELRVKRMTGTVSNQVPDNRVSDQREVADGIENLVPDELVFEPQRVVEHAGLAEDDGVIKRATERQAVLPQHFDILQEGKCPRWRNLFNEALFGDSDGARLMPEQRMVVADAIGDFEMI